jgi:hypothetical protein
MTWRFDWITTWGEIWAPEFVSQWQRWFDARPSAHGGCNPRAIRTCCETYPARRIVSPELLIVLSKNGVHSTTHFDRLCARRFLKGFERETQHCQDY